MQCHLCWNSLDDWLYEVFSHNAKVSQLFPTWIVNLIFSEQLDCSRLYLRQQATSKQSNMICMDADLAGKAARIAIAAESPILRSTARWTFPVSWHSNWPWCMHALFSSGSMLLSIRWSHIERSFVLMLLSEKILVVATVTRRYF